jgi:hypothetical protein
MVVSAEDQVLVGIEHGCLSQALAGLSPELHGAIEAAVLDGCRWRHSLRGVRASYGARTGDRQWMSAAGRTSRSSWQRGR